MAVLIFSGVYKEESSLAIVFVREVFNGDGN